MLKTKSFAFLLAIFALFTLGSQVVHSDSYNPEKLFVVLIDEHAVTESHNNIDLTKSFVGLLEALKDGQKIAFINATDGIVHGPAVAGSPEFTTIKNNMVENLSPSQNGRESDLVTSLVPAYELFDLKRAAKGSIVYVVSGGESDSVLGEASSRLSTLLDKFKENQWSIIGISVPGSSPYTSQFFEMTSEAMGEQIYPLSVPEGFTTFADGLLMKDAIGTFTQLGEASLTSNEVLTSTLDIAPGTTQTTVMFLKNEPNGSLRLRNPSGFEASEGDRVLSSVIETPYIVIWRLVEPTPGQWTVDMRAIEGPISSWYFSANKFSLNLMTSTNVPFDQEIPLVVMVSEGTEKVSLANVEIRARITDENGSGLIHTLNDRGELGDALPNDGYFSTTIAPLGKESEFSLDLELHWPEYNHYITSNEIIVTQAFPSIDVQYIHSGSLKPGERTLIATGEVNVKGQPYAVPTTDFQVEVNSNYDNEGVLEIYPQRLVNEGHAWQFDIFYTAKQEDLYSFLFRLDTNYGGEQYSFSTDTSVISSMVPVVLPVASSETEPTPPTPLTVTPNSDTSLLELIGIPTIILIGLVLYITLLLNRTKPYGYLYSDRGDIIADFSSLKRKTLAAFFTKNSVRGSELGVQELSGVIFKFNKEGVDLKSSHTEPSVRLNNRPLIEGERAPLFDRSWIGTRGKLFSYLTTPSFHGEPGIGDD